MTESDSFGWGSLLLAVISGLGLGGGLPPLARWIAGGLLRRAADALGERVSRKLRGAVSAAEPSSTATVEAAPPVTATPAERQAAVASAPRPAEVVHTQHEFVPYEKPSGELAAYKQALKDLVQHYPGTADWARQLEAFKEQILAGVAKGAR